MKMRMKVISRKIVIPALIAVVLSTALLAGPLCRTAQASPYMGRDIACYYDAGGIWLGAASRGFIAWGMHSDAKINWLCEKTP